MRIMSIVSYRVRLYSSGGRVARQRSAKEQTCNCISQLLLLDSSEVAEQETTTRTAYVAGCEQAKYMHGKTAHTSFISPMNRIAEFSQHIKRYPPYLIREASVKKAK